MGAVSSALELLDLGDWLSLYDEVKPARYPHVRVRSCPNCGKDKFKLYVNTELKVWHCKHCDWGRGLGDPVVLMAAVAGKTHGEVYKELGAYATPTVGDEFLAELERRLEAPAAKVEGKKEVPTLALPGSTTFSGNVGQVVINYAFSRGIDQSILEKYEMRVAWKLQGLPGPYLVFPVKKDERVVAWTGRTLRKGSVKYVSAGDIANVVWPLQDLPKDAERVLVVEGPMDALGGRYIGEHSVCTFGSTISDAQVEILKQREVKHLVLGWDADAKRNIQQTVIRLRGQFQLSVVDMSKIPAGMSGKVDFGDCLGNPALLEWGKTRVASAMQVESTEYLQWCLE